MHTDNLLPNAAPFRDAIEGQVLNSGALGQCPLGTSPLRKIRFTKVR